MSPTATAEPALVPFKIVFRRLDANTVSSLGVPPSLIQPLIQLAYLASQKTVTKLANDFAAHHNTMKLSEMMKSAGVYQVYDARDQSPRTLALLWSDVLYIG